MATQLSSKRVPDSFTIPDRLYFKIGDVARICAVEAYVLRFWETQFPQLKPNKSGTGQRLYRRREVELALEIKRLVHGEGYTLSGARHALEQGRRRVEVEAPVAQPVGESDLRHNALAEAVGHIRSELREIADMLASPVPRPLRRRPRQTGKPVTSDTLFPS